ncbi:hypothetical protein H0G86_004600 [Trichoderma simmonsii]|uniref:Uncharacterized protein n=1 Tax=Trichoderma simmonsii TaxID=1491479 RepID=A0A8G0PEA6_9HYPO|nr:hypothetical protein H0G86_004600 [Trichoderma simmonsii]
MYEYVRVRASPSRVLSCVARKPGCKSASLASVHGDVMSLPGRPDSSERLPAAESQHPVQSNGRQPQLLRPIRYATATLTCPPARAESCSTQGQTSYGGFVRTSPTGQSNAASVARSDCGSDMLHASRAGSMAAASPASLSEVVDLQRRPS